LEGEECLPLGEAPAGVLQLTDALAGAQYFDCRPPRAGEGALDVDAVTGTAATVTGSSARFEVEWSGAASASGGDLIFWNANSTLPTGYFRIPVAAADAGGAIADGQPLAIDLRISPEASSGPVTLGFALASETEAERNPPLIGARQETSLQVIRVGGGDVQINLNWTTLTDLDLRVVDPEGFEIYFNDPVSESGGQLDLDSRASCDFDDAGRGNENVFWPRDVAPAGNYEVLVNMYSDCGTFATDVDTDFTVSVILDGTDLSVHEGSFTPGGPDSISVVTFDYP
jgi:hypothetical protein